MYVGRGGGERVCYYVDWFGISVNSKACAFGISIVVREQQRDLPRKDTFYRVPNTRGWHKQAEGQHQFLTG